MQKEKEREKEINNNNEIIINTDFNDLEKIEVLNESSANRVNISKQAKLHDSSYLSLFELMDQPSSSKIYIDFPEIKPIKFSKNDFYGKNDILIRRLVRKGIPDNFLFTLKRNRPKKKVTLYTPQKIKIGKRYLITKKLNNERNNIHVNMNNINNFNNNNYEENDIDLENIEIKNLNIYESKNKNKKNNFIVSPEINLNSDVDSYNDLFNSNDNSGIFKKGNKNNRFYKHKNEQNNMEINTYKNHTNDLKNLLNINTNTSKQSDSPVIMKKLKITTKNSDNTDITNLGKIKNDNDNDNE